MPPPASRALMADAAVAQPAGSGVAGTGLRPQYRVLGAISLSHFLNDTIQSLMMAIYPLFKTGFNLSFSQIGLITLVYQCTASLLQPVVGFYTDKHPKPYSLTFGMACTLGGLLTLSFAAQYEVLLLGAGLVGLGSSVFHPESSRVARMASGGRFGMAQSVYQVGGNAGTAVGPLLAAWVVLPHGQRSIAWFSAVALLAMGVLAAIGHWYAHRSRQPTSRVTSAPAPLPRHLVRRTLAVLLALIFSKYFYMASISSYLTFYLMHKFGISTDASQYYLFVFLGAVAAGTLLGGPIGDRIGRKAVIWISILGVAPFTLALPYAGLGLTAVLSAIIGFLLASAFPAMIVYGQELIPGKVGTISGLFFGFAFGLGGLGSGVLGHMADLWGIERVYQVCAFLPLLGLLAVFLPDLRAHAPAKNAAKLPCTAGAA